MRSRRPLAFSALLLTLFLVAGLPGGGAEGADGLEVRIEARAVFTAENATSGLLLRFNSGAVGDFSARIELSFKVGLSAGRVVASLNGAEDSALLSNSVEIRVRCRMAGFGDELRVAVEGYISRVELVPPVVIELKRAEPGFGAVEAIPFAVFLFPILLMVAVKLRRREAVVVPEE